MSSKMLSLFRHTALKQYSRALKNVATVGTKNYCSTSGDTEKRKILDIPLSEKVPWIAEPKYPVIKDDQYETQVTTLENGLRVATENKFGQFSTIGVLIDSGSRYEVNFSSGITHFLEKLAFNSTSEYQDRDVILQMLEQHGGICDCQGSRDTLIYAVSANTEGTEKVTELLAEVVLRPQITQEELEHSQMAIQFELENLDMRPDPEPLLVELAHGAAYRQNTLGLPKICPPDYISTINRGQLYTYLKNLHTPDRMVVAGVGVEHDRLVEAVRKEFLGRTPIWNELPGIIDGSKSLDRSVAQYTGGMLKVEKNLSNVSLGPTPIPELAHVVIALESCSHKDDEDFVAFCVLNMMMGGGGSFSAGGPGKGMYTRLYTNVLNRCHWMYNATAYNHAYDDSGIFCIHASAHPSMLKDLVSTIVKEMVNTQHSISDSELARAKTQLQSMLLMNLESRPVAFEDVGRQVLANGHRKPATHYFDEIGRITREDVVRVARRMLRAPPAVAAYGTLDRLPSLDDIQQGLASKDGAMPRRFSLFRS